MRTTTMGVKLDETTRDRIKKAAYALDRTPHWLMKQAIISYLEQLDQGQISVNSLTTPEQVVELDTLSDIVSDQEYQPFLDFAESIHPQSVNRAAITAAYRTAETEIIPRLVDQARLPDEQSQAVHQLAYNLAEKLRQQKSSIGRTGMVQSLLQEFSLSSSEGVALMCLAEALLRIPDKPTRDALIRDKISNGNWHAHLGQSPSMFVNAATWGLLFTGKLVSTHNQSQLSSSLNRIIGKSGEPLIRKGVDMAMRLMGEQFVTGETIGQALANAHKHEEQGFRYSYDMLGEAALTEKDAQRYLFLYQQSIHAIGKASNRRGIYEGPGISIKLSALHPRYSRAQYERVIEELYPRLLNLTLLARQYDIGINIDAEEADRLEISLDLLEKLCFEPQLANWNGIGFVIQAYQKRCPHVIDYVIDLAHRSQHRLMIRLVKGAYWDSEIKRAQVDGLEGYPVYTRKVYTDISYLACARKLLNAPEAIYPQFATHNAHTVAAIYYLAGQNYYPGQYEFQCLHGMGEPLYYQVVGKHAEGKLQRPCRIYAPVGTHETLLAYLVRRLLENGANTSFVNRIADSTISLDELVADPVTVIESLAITEGGMGKPHPKIPLPRQLYGSARLNASGLDLSNEHRLASLSCALLSSGSNHYSAFPLIEGQQQDATDTQHDIVILNPADHRDCIGNVRHANEQQVRIAINNAVNFTPIWSSTPPEQRAELLNRTALLMEDQLQQLIGLLVREAGKTFNNAIAEVREAVDFLRYYAELVQHDFSNQTHRPLGPVVCISPWNFPLAIFTGQIAAALVTGNTVLAKPAEQTPLIAFQVIQLMYQAGIPPAAVQLLLGAGETVGAQLVNDQRIRGVMFTGSTEVAMILQRHLAGRLAPDGQTIPLIAETGGLNAMIVDSSALTEQVVADVMASAFDSAGQRCSALRILCLQDDIAERTLTMLKGAMGEYRMGDPDNLSTDMGPVIDAQAKQRIEKHIATMRAKGYSVYQASFDQDITPIACSKGTFVKPTLIELDHLADLTKEIFGPVLHIVRYQRQDMAQLVEQINAAGYGLTMGIHTRIDETIGQITAQAKVGNLYVNRNIVGAVVGVQPFGGEGLSGTGPKAGGPLYLYRLLARRPDDALSNALLRSSQWCQVDSQLKDSLLKPLQQLKQWALSQGKSELAQLCDHYADYSQVGTTRLLNGPTGERNSYILRPRQTILCLYECQIDGLNQLAAVLASGSTALWSNNQQTQKLYQLLSEPIRAHITFVDDWNQQEHVFEAVIYHGDSDKLQLVSQQIAQRDGPIISVQGFASGDTAILLERLLIEQSISINTAAAGGNASLMTIG